MFWGSILFHGFFMKSVDARLSKLQDLLGILYFIMGFLFGGN